MKFIENYKAKLKKKTKWSWASDIIFILLIIALIIPSTRTPLVVFIKKATLMSPSVSEKDNFGQLSANDLNWTLVDAEGQTVQLKDLTDKPVFINFWASWCAPCIAEMPSIEKLVADYQDKVYFVIASYEDQAIINTFRKKQELNLPFYRYSFAEPALLQSKTIPATFIINTKGEIVVSEKGSSDWNSKSVRKLLDRLIKEK
jgi:thiol-disulfide isomerase/thioredoxin